MRIDKALFERNMAPSRTAAAELIARGLVLVDGQKAKKASQEVPDTAELVVLASLPYVSRGGEKLAHALATFAINPAGLTAVDIGSSTGGFTDCLLQHGATKVYAVDVGSDQLAPRLRADRRVVVMEKTDIRTVSLPERVDLAVIDVSFISLTYILGPISTFVKENGTVIALIKPQFEVGKESLGKGGIVRDEQARLDTLERIKTFARDVGYVVLAEAVSPITGGDGNIEFLLHMKKSS